MSGSQARSLRSLRKTELGSKLIEQLPDATACLAGNSYVVFLFTEDRLIRVVTRLTPDCSSRKEILRAFANKYGIPFNPYSTVLFQQSTAMVTVGGYVSSDGVFSLDIFRNGTPNPAR
jgi:hypothetical protein